MKVQLITLGCAKNRVDSEHLLAQLAAAGVEIYPESAPLEGAGVDVLILNTCGFIGDAKEESIQAILEALEARDKGIVGKVFAFGCLTGRYYDELKAEIPELDGIFGANAAGEILSALNVRWTPQNATDRWLTTPKHYAYLKISEGCDRSCAYCAIPGIRGKHVSESVETLVEETQRLAQQGVRELLVVAQDTTFYGLDNYHKRMVAPLLQRLSEVSGIEWIRLHYSYPAAFPDDLLDLMATNPKICKYIDIPLQHSSTKVLQLMRRSIDGKQTRELIEKFRTKVPGVALRTTMIVGHPGEGAREFADLLDFVEQARFERLGAFTYSEEEGTYGAENYKDTISARVKQERYNRLMELQSGISLDYNLSRVGSVERVIVDDVDNDVMVCRSSRESVEVDGQILVKAQQPCARLVGSFVNARITGADEYDLAAEMV